MFGEFDLSGEIGRDDVLDRVVSVCIDRSLKPYSRVVDEDIDTPKRVANLLECLISLVCIGDIAHDDE